MARKAADIVAVKVRMRKDLRRQIEKLARKNDQSVNAQTVLLLEAAVLAEHSGVSGIGGVITSVQSSTAAFAVEETLKKLGVPLPEPQPSLTKRSDQ